MKIPAQVCDRGQEFEFSYKSAFVTDRDAWNQLVFARGDHDLVQGYEWGEFRRYAGFTPYRLAVRNGDEVGALSNILVARSPLVPSCIRPTDPYLPSRQP